MIGTLGPWELEFLDAPRARTGRAKVKARLKSGGDWREVEVAWATDAQGIRLELVDQVLSFDARGSVNDDGNTQFQLLGRGAAGEWNGLRFVRRGEEANAQGGAAARKGWKLKAQMPGKIVKILVGAGASVERGQPIMVMEAMKMENEIKAPGVGKVAQLAVTVGQAVETGALLAVIE